MARFATTAIIGLALVCAGVESHADDLARAAPAKSPAVPVEQLLADAAPGPATAAPSPDALPPPSLRVGAAIGPMPRPPGPDGMGWGGSPPMHPGMWTMRMRQMEQTWGLFFNQRDKNLSDTDVQVLAEAILLVHGNHEWKVTNVADAADGQATFAYATADGSVIARFEIDRHSGRVTRIG